MSRLSSFFILSLVLLNGLLLSSCSSITVEDYQQFEPKLIAEQFFDGKLTAHGVVKDRGGKVIRSFNADIIAYWKDGVGTLEEDFVFDDGEQQRRVWTLTPNGENRYVGTAGDVVGTSDVSVAGNSMFLNYVLRIAYGDGAIDIQIDDRMYLVSDTVLINQSRMSKWGFDIGELLLVIEKR
jgi:hypothetical protein